MKSLVAGVLVLVAAFYPANAQVNDDCDVPSYLTSGEQSLPRVAKAAKETRKLDVLVLGTGSSTLAGPDGANRAYPARMAAALQQRIPGLNVRVQSLAKMGQTADEMVASMNKSVLDQRPALVIWQSGTVDAMRGIDPDTFQATLHKGITTLKAAGADVILMNMQYSPRTESMIALSSYADIMRFIARDDEVPLFDRFAIMRHWTDTGSFDLYAASKDSALAQRVHDCLGRALASVVIESAQLNGHANRTPQ